MHIFERDSFCRNASGPAAPWPKDSQKTTYKDQDRIKM